MKVARLGHLIKKVSNIKANTFHRLLQIYYDNDNADIVLSRILKSSKTDPNFLNEISSLNILSIDEIQLIDFPLFELCFELLKRLGFDPIKNKNQQVIGTGSFQQIVMKSNLKEFKHLHLFHHDWWKKIFEYAIQFHKQFRQKNCDTMSWIISQISIGNYSENLNEYLQKKWIGKIKNFDPNNIYIVGTKKEQNIINEHIKKSLNPEKFPYTITYFANKPGENIYLANPTILDLQQNCQIRILNNMYHPKTGKILLSTGMIGKIIGLEYIQNSDSYTYVGCKIQYKIKNLKISMVVPFISQKDTDSNSINHNLLLHIPLELAWAKTATSCIGDNFENKNIFIFPQNLKSKGLFTTTVGRCNKYKNLFFATLDDNIETPNFETYITYDKEIQNYISLLQQRQPNDYKNVYLQPPLIQLEKIFTPSLIEPYISETDLNECSDSDTDIETQSHLKTQYVDSIHINSMKKIKKTAFEKEFLHQKNFNPFVIIPFDNAHYNTSIAILLFSNTNLMNKIKTKFLQSESKILNWFLQKLRFISTQHTLNLHHTNELTSSVFINEKNHYKNTKNFYCKQLEKALDNDNTHQTIYKCNAFCRHCSKTENTSKKIKKQSSFLNISCTNKNISFQELLSKDVQNPQICLKCKTSFFSSIKLLKLPHIFITELHYLKNSTLTLSKKFKHNQISYSLTGFVLCIKNSFIIVTNCHLPICTLWYVRSTNKDYTKI